MGQWGGIYGAQWGGRDLPARGNVSPRRNTCHLLDDKVDMVFGDCCQTPPVPQTSAGPTAPHWGRDNNLPSTVQPCPNIDLAG